MITLHPRKLAALFRRLAGGRTEEASEAVDEPARDEPAASPPSASHRRLADLTDRTLAPLAPIFVVVAVTWPLEIPPERVLRSVLLMAVLGIESVATLSLRVAAEGPLLQFMRLNRRDAALDVASLTAGQARLIENSTFRTVVQTVVTSARHEGLFREAGFAVNEPLVAAWTTERAGPLPANAPAISRAASAS